jgi:type IV secretion system protein VirB2
MTTQFGSSLFDPAGQSSLARGIGWLEGAVVGPVAGVIAVVAVAGVGLMLLTGRIAVRRGAAVILGCFLVFGARSIAAGLVGGGGEVPGSARFDAEAPSALPTAASSPQPYDPYAGASLVR